MNGEPGQPLLVSMLLYLDDQWPRDWGAETLFLDGQVSLWHLSGLHALCQSSVLLNEGGYARHGKQGFTQTWVNPGAVQTPLGSVSAHLGTIE